jgi:hypothetical protein
MWILSATISSIYKQGQGGTTGRFCTEAAATARKQLFLNRKSCTGSEVSGQYSIRFGFLIFEQLNCKSNFCKFQPPNPFYFLTAFGAVRYTYNGIQGELPLLLDQYCYCL